MIPASWLYRIYSSIFVKGSNKFHIVDSISEGLTSILLDQPISNDPPASIPLAELNSDSLRKKSKDELIGIIEGFKQAHQESSNKIVNAVGQIYEKEKFDHSALDVNENDP